MPSTHVSLHYHIIFCTKDRRRIIAEPWRAELHAYIGGIIRDIDAVARSIGGPGDHVQVLLGLKAAWSTTRGTCGEVPRTPLGCGRAWRIGTRGCARLHSLTPG